MQAPQNSRVAAVVALVLFAAIAGFMLLPLWQQVARPLLGLAPLPAGLSVGAAWSLLALGLAIALLLGSRVYRQVATRIDEQGLVVPGLGVPRRVRWSEVRQVSGRGFQVRLLTDRGSVHVNVLCYAPPSSVLPYLMSRLPEHLVGGAGRPA